MTEILIAVYRPYVALVYLSIDKCIAKYHS